MGTRVFSTGGMITCPYCKQKKNYLKSVNSFGQICEDCFEKNGGQDYIDAMKELDEIYKGVKK